MTPRFATQWKPFRIVSDEAANVLSDKTTSESFFVFEELSKVPDKIRRIHRFFEPASSVEFDEGAKT